MYKVKTYQHNKLTSAQAPPKIYRNFLQNLLECSKWSQPSNVLAAAFFKMQEKSKEKSKWFSGKLQNVRRIILKRDDRKNLVNQPFVKYVLHALYVQFYAFPILSQNGNEKVGLHLRTVKKHCNKTGFT